MTDRLPLFLLNTVLFPAMQLPLQVFEPRYLDMIGRCLEQDRVFGVSLIRSGPEVGGPAEPESVGTTARIASAQEQSDGRILLVCEGERRYRILETDDSRPYLQARVELLDDELGPQDTALGHKVFASFRDALSAMGLQVAFDETLIDQPERISYLVAAYLNRPSSDKQRLLETSSVAERLRIEDGWLLELIEALRARKQVEQVAGRNGRVRSKI
jgi:uncharacterized protein